MPNDEERYDESADDAQRDEAVTSGDGAQDAADVDSDAGADETNADASGAESDTAGADSEAVDADADAEAADSEAAATEAAALEAARQRDLVREKAARVNAKLARRRLLSRAAIGVGVLAVIAAIVAIVLVIVSQEKVQPQGPPQGATAGGFDLTADTFVLPTEVDPLPVPTITPAPESTDASDGEPAETDPVSVVVYYDYHSEGAAQFTTANAASLHRMLQDESITLSYRPVATLTGQSGGTKYSSRAANAAACVEDGDPTAFLAFTYRALEQMTTADAAGLTDDELASIAVSAAPGAKRDLQECITEGLFDSWVHDSTEAFLAMVDSKAGEAGYDMLPIVLVDGVPYLGALDDVSEFRHAVFTAESAKYTDATDQTVPTPEPSEDSKDSKSSEDSKDSKSSKDSKNSKSAKDSKESDSSDEQSDAKDSESDQGSSADSDAE